MRGYVVEILLALAITAVLILVSSVSYEPASPPSHPVPAAESAAATGP